MPQFGDLDDFTRDYIECALWSENDESTPSGGEPFDRNYSVDDIADEAINRMADDCRKFQEQHAELLARAYALKVPIKWEGREIPYGPAQAGYDFWLTRNGHGVGFWDRDLGEVGDLLSSAADAFGECHLYLGDDVAEDGPKIYVS